MEDLDPPRDVAAEESLLGSMLWDAAATSAALDRVGSTDMTSAGREMLFDAIVNAQGKCDGTASLVMVFDELRKRGEERRVDALELARLFDLVPSGASAGHYSAIVARMARRRRIMAAAEDLYRRAADLTTPEDGLTFPESLSK
jgi:replicative DNA helicase